MRFISVLLLIIASMISVADAQSYLCVGDKATGFKFNPTTKQWDIASFEASQQKHIVRKPNEQDQRRFKKPFAFLVLSAGNSLPDFFCSDGFNENGMMRCRGLNGRFDINIKLGRYISDYRFGYVDENELTGIYPKRNEGDDTPALVIGRCSPL